MAGASKKSYRHKNGKQVSYYTATYRDMYGKQHTAGRFKTKSEALKHRIETRRKFSRYYRYNI